MRTSPSGPWKSLERLSALSMFFVSLLLCFACSRAPTSPELTPEKKKQRIASLSPAITATIQELQATEKLVGVSDYCSTPTSLPQLGTAITPNFEAIARVAPTWIAATNLAGSSAEQLKAIAPLNNYAWLTLREMTGSIRALGKKIERQTAANALAEHLEKELGQKENPQAPKVLLVWESAQGDPSTYFVRKNSAHGGLLAAAGLQNAIQEEIQGVPRLSLEELLQLNPDGILVLRQGSADKEAEEKILQSYQKLSPLQALGNGQIAVLSHPEVLSMGPGLLRTSRALQEITKGWKSE
ncbi:MAG: ABC transporter substrate-binding protein [Polyangiaceae bacterium]|nr:ABC transporter substrate-binding protein [Polyangiaceae bacterium]